MTALTERVKVFVSVSDPSETTTVMSVVPCLSAAGAKLIEQFGAVPDVVMPDAGKRAIFDEVTFTEEEQFSACSRSLIVKETDLAVSSLVF